MKLKRIFPSVLALAMTLSALTLGASAQGDTAAVPEAMLLIAPNPMAAKASGYNGAVVVDGVEVTSVRYSRPDASDYTIPIGDLPAAPAGYVPMRLLCQAVSGGTATWYKAEDKAVFFLNGHTITTNFADSSVLLEGKRVSGVTCRLAEPGVTYLPASFLASLGDIDLFSYDEDDGSQCFNFTLITDPALKVAKKIVSTVGMNATMALDPDILDALGIRTANFESVGGYMSMMNIMADTVIVGKYAAGADKTAAKADFEARKADVMQNYEHYLPDVYELASNGKVVESKDGKWLMLILSADNDTAVSLFESAVAGK